MTGTTVSVCLLFILSVCSACYISNCPIGGKRSVMDAPLRKVSSFLQLFLEIVSPGSQKVYKNLSEPLSAML